jgi:membrane protease YdiL (CAAX protease family)
MKTTNRSPLQRVLNVWAIILIIWSIYRAYFKTDLPIWFDEFIAKPIVFLGPVYYYITRVEKKDFFAGVDLKFHGLSSNIILGFFIGLIFFASGALGLVLKSQSIVEPFKSLPPISTILFFLMIAVVTSVSEEVVSRGFVLRRFYDESKSVVTSSFLTSILFFFLHVPILFTNEKIIGFTLIRVMMTDLVLSLAVSFIYLERRSLVLPIMIHSFYNLSLYLFM